MTDTTTNQTCLGTGEKRMEKRDAREREQDANAPCLRARRERGGNVSASSMIAWYFWALHPLPWPQYDDDGDQYSGQARTNID